MGNIKAGEGFKPTIAQRLVMDLVSDQEANVLLAQAAIDQAILDSASQESALKALEATLRAEIAERDERIATFRQVEADVLNLQSRLQARIQAEREAAAAEATASLQAQIDAAVTTARAEWEAAAQAADLAKAADPALGVGGTVKPSEAERLAAEDQGKVDPTR